MVYVATLPIPRPIATKILFWWSSGSRSSPSPNYTPLQATCMRKNALRKKPHKICKANNMNATEILAKCMSAFMATCPMSTLLCAIPWVLLGVLKFRGPPNQLHGIKEHCKIMVLAWQPSPNQLPCNKNCYQTCMSVVAWLAWQPSPNQLPQNA